MICARCHRPLKNPSTSGYGPVCAKAMKPVEDYERDLLDYDLDLASLVAYRRVAVLIKGLAAEARIAVRHEFAAARRRLGVWA